MIVFIFLIKAFSIFATDILDSTFAQAALAYQNKDFQTSLQLFLQLENENILQADLYYNIGNCYFQLNQIGKAILYYKRCLKYEPGHEQAFKNVTLALTLTKDKQTFEQEDFLSGIWNRFLKMFSLNLLAMILIIIFSLIVTIINFIIIRYRNREKTAPMFFLFIFIFIFAFFLLVSKTQWDRFHNHKNAVLLAATEIGYSGPSEDFTRVFTIHEGMILEIEKADSDWTLIKLANGLGGWIRTASFERI
jgi:tetratricopeptide (TPR) repeat protein